MRPEIDAVTNICRPNEQSRRFFVIKVSENGVVKQALVKILCCEIAPPIACRCEPNYTDRRESLKNKLSIYITVQELFFEIRKRPVPVSA